MKFRFRIEAVNVEGLDAYRLTNVELSIVCTDTAALGLAAGRLTLQFHGNHFAHFRDLAQTNFSDPFEIPLPEPMERK